ncbi:MAG: PIN domain nuclease [Ilumatobacteraceae bacterium]|jgi:hypothetical protein|nr:PIN domain nuclease [Ilumatobacteraceae bacterium]
MPAEPLLADTSAWIEFLRGTGSAACAAVEQGLRQQSLVVTDPVIGELLGGARPHEVDPLLRLLNEQDYRPVAARVDWLDAAEIRRGCRALGLTVRSLTDCLVAAVAIRLDVPVLHHDRDFEAIASVTRLRTRPSRAGTAGP